MKRLMPAILTLWACLTLCVLSPTAVAQAPPTTLTLWHSYIGNEETALKQVIADFAKQRPDITVQVQGVPYGGYPEKIENAIGLASGPDVFIFAHERIGGWVTRKIIAPTPLTDGALTAYLPETLAPLHYKGTLYGLPLAFKSLALFYNRAVIDEPPADTDALIALGERLASKKIFPIAYPATKFYFHAPWYFGFGGEIFGPDMRVAFDGPGALASFRFVADLTERGFIPEEPTDAVINHLFNSGQAASVISGPWFLSSIDETLDFGVAPLPIVSATGVRAKPLLTVEAALVSAKTAHPAAAWALATFLAADPVAASVRALVGRQTVAAVSAWEDPQVSGDPTLSAFRAQLQDTVPTDNRPEMTRVWSPANLALSKLLRGKATPEDAAEAAIRQHKIDSRPPPPPSSPTFYLIILAALAILALVILGRWVGRVRANKALAREAKRGWRWIAPASIATFVLVILPFGVCLAMALFAHHPDGSWSFVGVSNFGEILGTEYYDPLEPLAFYYALLITIVWTLANVAIHVGLGLGLALLLNRKLGGISPFYRVLLIVPWAVPNYITALIWKGMFHKQYGAINGMLEGLGLDGVSWFSDFGTAFFANLSTNAWLGFPFMMVVCLGALQSIPRDLLQAAEVDGASAWQRFRHVTLPLLKPALIPAILLGIVWTFNQFNIIYLVSGGEPDHSTEILITEAYKWAFERGDRYGFAAAYGAMIFGALLIWSWISVRIAKRVEETYT